MEVEVEAWAAPQSLVGVLYTAMEGVVSSCRLLVALRRLSQISVGIQPRSVKVTDGTSQNCGIF